VLGEGVAAGRWGSARTGRRSVEQVRGLPVTRGARASREAPCFGGARCWLPGLEAGREWSRSGIDRAAIGISMACRVVAVRRIVLVAAIHAAVVTGASTAHPGRARAQDEPAAVALTWTAPPGCIQRAALERAVEAMLEHPVWAEPGAADVGVDASLALDDGEWVLRLAMRSGESILGTREARRDGGDCRSIERTAVVVLALLVDLPRRDVRLRVAVDAGEVARDEIPIMAASPPSEPRTPASTRGIEARLGAHVVLDLGALPGPAAGGELSAAVVPGASWPAIRLAARALAPSDTALDADGRGASVWLAGGLLETCPEATIEVAVLGGCAGVALDAMIGTGRGLDSERTVVGVRWSAQATAVLGLRLDIAELRLATGAAVTLARDSFVRDPGTAAETVLHAPAWVSFVTTLGVTVRVAP
jgi:hypothetical protein